MAKEGGYLRSFFRRALRLAAAKGPGFVRRLAFRCYLSRLNRFVRYLMDGEEEIEFRGARISVHCSDFFGFSVFLGELERSQEIETLVAFASRARLFADVGANIGMMTVPAALHSPGLEVHSFEPDASNLRILRKNAAMNPSAAGRITVAATAVGDRNGEVAFQSEPNDSAQGKIAVDPARGTHTVPVTTLDRYFGELGRFPDLVKIDVEGAELSVLAGMAGILAQHPPATIFIEIHAYLTADPPAFKKSIRDILLAAGYRLYHPSFQQESPATPWEDVKAWPGHLLIIALHENRNAKLPVESPSSLEATP